LRAAAERCKSPELASLADTAGALRTAAAKDLQDSAQYCQDKDGLRTCLISLFRENSAAAAAVDAVIAKINADPDRLDKLLEGQHYRLAFWQASFSELGYRRFFDINHLIGVRVEDETVFRTTHKLILRWLAEGVLDGVRIDHIDGLYDPAQYLSRLSATVPDAWIIVEKILGPEEDLPDAWNVAGTTGYDFAGMVNAVLVNPEGEEPLMKCYIEFTGQSADYAAVVHDAKLLVLREMLGSDVKRLAAMLKRIYDGHWRWRDFSREEIDAALRELVACYPVYRGYVRPGTGGVGDSEVRYMDDAIKRARQWRPDIDGGLLDFFRDIFLLRVAGSLESDTAMRFQQLTGPAMAKGVEDTAFYCFNRLVSLNEVGGDPGRFSLSVEAFHRKCIEKRRRWPQGMLTTGTHDTKRSDDVRSRINLLSEIPAVWRNAVLRWSAMNAPYHTRGAPDRNAEYLFYQTLIGAWPIDADRMAA